MMFDLINLLLLTGIVITGWLVISFDDLLSAVIALAGNGLFLTAEYLFLQAPDVALAEAAVGLAVTPLIFLVVLKKVRGEANEKVSK
jgi:energy-converting hydrogenase B subunit D